MQRSDKNNFDTQQVSTVTAILSRTRADYSQLDAIYQQQLNELGNVVLQGTRLYFEESKASKDCAKRFFTLLLNDKEAMREIKNQLDNKKKNLQKYDDEKVAASCISFVTADLAGTPVCFIAVSRARKEGKKLREDKKLLDELNRIAIQATHYRSIHNDIYTYIVIQEDSSDFKKIIKHETGDTRTCAEYDYGSVLKKLFEQYGTQLRVEGVVNCKMYEFGNTVKYNYSRQMNGQLIARPQKIATAEDKVFTSHKESRKLVLRNMPTHQEIFMMDCCSTCQGNKDAFIAALYCAQQEGKLAQSVQSTSIHTFLNQRDSSTAVEKSVSSKRKAPSAPPKPKLDFFAAYKKQNIRAINSLIKEGADINKQDQDGNSVLHHAMSPTSSEEFLRALFESPLLKVNMANKDGYTPLHLAVLNHHFLAVKMLLDHAALRVNFPVADKRSEIGATALHLAAEQKDTTILQLLLNHSQIDVNQAIVSVEKETEDETALSIAWKAGNKKAAVMLMRNGANLACLPMTERTHLLSFAMATHKKEQSFYMEILKQAITDGTLALSPNDKYFIKILIAVIKKDDIELLRAVYKRNSAIYFSILTTDEMTSTLLHLAVQHRAKAIVRDILSTNRKTANKRVLNQTPWDLAKDDKDLQAIFTEFGCGEVRPAGKKVTGNKSTSHKAVKSAGEKVTGNKSTLFKDKKEHDKADEYFYLDPGPIAVKCTLF